MVIKTFCFTAILFYLKLDFSNMAIEQIPNEQIQVSASSVENEVNWVPYDHKARK